MKAGNLAGPKLKVLPPSQKHLVLLNVILLQVLHETDEEIVFACNSENSWENSRKAAQHECTPTVEFLVDSGSAITSSTTTPT
ncbi:hypothetical protein Trydic_g7745 [Trypoxylus dichotomus]